MAATHNSQSSSEETVGETKQTRKYYSREEYYVVREDAGEEVKCRLEQSLEKEYKVVVVEAELLGDQAIRWIRFGNFLHKTAVLGSVGALACVPLVPRPALLYSALPLGLVGVSCTLLYGLSWARDPCSKFQVDSQGEQLARVPSHDLHSPSPTVLVYRNDKYRKRLHNTLAVVVVAVLSWKIYHSLSC